MSHSTYNFFILAVLFFSTAQAQITSTTEPEEIVVTAYNPCALSTIQKEIENKVTPNPEIGLFAKILEVNDYDGYKYSLSCEGQLNCKGHLFLAYSSATDITATPKNNELEITVQGRVHNNCPLGKMRVNKLCRVKNNCALQNECGIQRDFIRTISVPQENIFIADESNISLTCEPGDCEAIRFGDGVEKNKVLLLKKNKAGIVTPQLIVNTQQIEIFADNDLNISGRAKKLKACPSAPKKQQSRQQGRSRQRGAR